MVHLVALLSRLSVVIYPVRHPQPHSQGDIGSCFTSQRRQHGQCLVQNCFLPWSLSPPPVPSGDRTRRCLCLYNSTFVPLRRSIPCLLGYNGRREKAMQLSVGTVMITTRHKGPDIAELPAIEGQSPNDFHEVFAQRYPLMEPLSALMDGHPTQGQIPHP